MLSTSSSVVTEIKASRSSFGSWYLTLMLLVPVIQLRMFQKNIYKIQNYKSQIETQVLRLLPESLDSLVRRAEKVEALWTATMRVSPPTYRS